MFKGIIILLSRLLAVQDRQFVSLLRVDGSRIHGQDNRTKKGLLYVLLFIVLLFTACNEYVVPLMEYVEPEPLMSEQPITQVPNHLG